MPVKEYISGFAETERFPAGMVHTYGAFPLSGSILYDPPAVLRVNHTTLSGAYHVEGTAIIVQPDHPHDKQEHLLLIQFHNQHSVFVVQDCHSVHAEGIGSHVFQNPQLALLIH